MLESALDPAERASLGAHYTPRPYVERLVISTVMEPLRADWAETQTRIEDLRQQGDARAALKVAQDFHRKLCTTRVLDPACGTGNFLYVSLELMKRLEGKVLDAIQALGGEPESIKDYPEYWTTGQQLARSGGRFKVSPAQFHGLELNERAVPIADLVLWLGYLKWELRTSGLDKLTEPILDAYGTIRHQDALIACDGKELARDAQGNLITIWDGVTRKLHPITGEMVPDEAARRETYRYVKPRRAEWPEAEFIVGNPPFISGKDMRPAPFQAAAAAVRAGGADQGCPIVFPDGLVTGRPQAMSGLVSLPPEGWDYALFTSTEILGRANGCGRAGGRSGESCVWKPPPPGAPSRTWRSGRRRTKRATRSSR